MAYFSANVYKNAVKIGENETKAVAFTRPNLIDILNIGR